MRRTQRQPDGDLPFVAPSAAIRATRNCWAVEDDRGSDLPQRATVAGAPRARSSARLLRRSAARRTDSNASRRAVQPVAGLRTVAESAQCAAEQQLRAGVFEGAGALGVQFERGAVVVQGVGSRGQQGAAAGAEGQFVGAADGSGPPVVVGVRGAGDARVAGAHGGLDIVRGRRVADCAVAVSGSEGGEGAQPGRGGSVAPGAEVEEGERPLGERGGQAQAVGEGVGTGGRGAPRQTSPSPVTAANMARAAWR